MPWAECGGAAQCRGMLETMAAHPGKDIIVVAASAGGLIPLRDFLAGLPADLPASVVTVLHIPATGGQALPGILDRSGPLAAALAVDSEKLVHGRVYVAPGRPSCPHRQRHDPAVAGAAPERGPSGR